MKKKLTTSNRCGDCSRFDECNAALAGELDPNESFPEVNGCLVFRPKEDKHDARRV